MNEIKSTHYLLVADAIFNDGENAHRYNALLWWNVKHRNVTLKLRTATENGKLITIMTLVTPDDRADLVTEFGELASKVNGLYPMYDLITACGHLSIKDLQEDNR